jgi:PhnB protein
MIMIQVYLNFPGNAREAIAFYQTVFAAETRAVMTYADLEGGKDAVPASLHDKILHAELIVFDSRLMIADWVLESPLPYRFGTNIAAAITTSDAHRLTDAWKRMAPSSNIVMDLAPTFFSPLYGNLIDKFQVPWQFILEGSVKA